MNKNDSVYYIPGVPKPVPVDMVTDLEDGSVVHADILDPQQPVWYRFYVEGDNPVTIAFQGPASEYTIQHFKKSDEKGGTGNAHEEEEDDVVTYTFAEPGPYTIFFSVASTDQKNWPSRGYIISMSVANA